MKKFHVVQVKNIHIIFDHFWVRGDHRTVIMVAGTCVFFLFVGDTGIEYKIHILLRQ